MLKALHVAVMLETHPGFKGFAGGVAHQSKAGTPIGGQWGCSRENFENFISNGTKREEELMQGYTLIIKVYHHPWKVESPGSGARIEVQN